MKGSTYISRGRHESLAYSSVTHMAFQINHLAAMCSRCSGWTLVQPWQWRICSSRWSLGSTLEPTGRGPLAAVLGLVIEISLGKCQSSCLFVSCQWAFGILEALQSLEPAAVILSSSPSPSSKVVIVPFAFASSDGLAVFTFESLNLSQTRIAPLFSQPSPYRPLVPLI